MESDTMCPVLETPLKALEREVFEELGWKRHEHYALSDLDPMSCPGSLPGLLTYEEHDAGSKGLHMNFAFLVQVHPDVEILANCDEFTEHRWVATLDSLGPDAKVPANVRVIATYLLERYASALKDFQWASAGTE